MSPIEAFCETAPTILNKFLPPNSCISRSRITIECLRTFGVLCEARSVTWGLEMKNRKLAYVVGVPPERQAEMRAQALSWVDSKLINEGGFYGHVIVVANRNTFIDPSFSQAFHAFVEQGNECPVEEFILAASNGELIPDDFHFIAELLTDDDVIRSTYIALDDASFKDTPAWELDSVMKFVILHLIHAVGSRLQDGLFHATKAC